VEEGELRVGPDGRTGVTLGRVEVFAPHMDRDWSPDSSWKWVARVPAETKLAVLGRVRGEASTFYKVALPSNATGFISAQYLREARPHEIDAWKKRVAQARQGEPEPADEEAADDAEAASPPRDSGSLDRDREADEPTIPTIPTIPADDERTSDAPGALDTGEAQSAPSEAGEEDAADAATPNDPLARPEETLPPAGDQPLTDGESSETPAPDATNEPSDKELAEVTLEDLESAYESLTEEPIREAEIEPLRQRYLAFVEETPGATKRQLAVAKTRVKMLEVRKELQEQMLRLDAIRRRAKLSAADAEAARITLEAAEDYAAVGRVTASTIYDGRRLPRLLRLIEPSSGRTVAYLEPDESFDFTGMIGQLVGIVGEKTYDPGLRLTIITPRRVDLLTPRG